ncbi:MAG TPA: DUF3027 domain-containing protein [Humibacter sp.]|nr:DUF3027 domain-containing protein [Humibacter sp.]
MPDVDEALVAAVAVAREALEEITPAWTIGSPAGYAVEGERVVSHRFACELPGYPGWNWTVTLARVDETSDPAVLEAELLPGDDALLAPDWVPWSERLADYQAALDASHLQQQAADDDDDEETDDADDDEDADDLDADDLDEGDIDGVDIDELHPIDEDDEAVEAADAEADAEAEDADSDYETDEITGAELAALQLQVDEPEDAQADADHGAPHPPQVAGGGEGSGSDQQRDEGDEPQH